MIIYLKIYIQIIQKDKIKMKKNKMTKILSEIKLKNYALIFYIILVIQYSLAFNY